MPTSSFEPSSKTFREIFGTDLTYQVPPFQRDYSWTQDEWSDLWQDIESVLSENGASIHYMGYLVLQRVEEKASNVIDGQQRITTLSLLSLAVLKCLQDLIESGVESDKNALRLDQLRKTYIGDLDPVSLVSKTKLTLNRNNDAYYRDHLVGLGRLPQRKLRASEHQLRKAFEWFYKKLKDRYASNVDGSQLALFLGQIADRLVFTAIHVTDELNAYKVFETLNARGVKLSPTDLLKNYIFSVVDREGRDVEEMKSLERRWEGMVGKLGSENFSDFLRVHWNSRNDFVRNADLFKRISGSILNKGAVFNLVKQMDEDLAIYLAFTSPADEMWSSDAQRYLADLNFYGIRQLLALLLAGHRKFSPADFIGLLRAGSIITFRYAVIGGYANNQLEHTYSSVAKGIASGEIQNLTGALNGLKQVYISDEVFKSMFSDRSFNTTQSRAAKMAKHILFKIENHISAIALDPNSERYNLEHVLPENPRNPWDDFDSQSFEDYVDRLGNISVMESSVNRDLGDRSYAEKMKGYGNSAISLTSEIPAQYGKWSRGAIEKRQAWMATQAAALWRIDQLS